MNNIIKKYLILSLIVVYCTATITSLDIAGLNDMASLNKDNEIDNNKYFCNISTNLICQHAQNTKSFSANNSINLINLFKKIFALDFSNYNNCEKIFFTKFLKYNIDLVFFPIKLDVKKIIYPFHYYW